MLDWRTAPRCGKSFSRTFVHEIKAVVLHDSNSSQRIFTALCVKEADAPAPPVRIYLPASSRTRDWGSTCRFLNHQPLLPVSGQLLLLFGLGLPPRAADLSSRCDSLIAQHEQRCTATDLLTFRLSRHNQRLYLSNVKRENFNNWS